MPKYKSIRSDRLYDIACKQQNHLRGAGMAKRWKHRFKYGWTSRKLNQ